MTSLLKDKQFQKQLLFVQSLLPLLFLLWDLRSEQLGANPYSALLHVTGGLALLFAALTLAVTPVMKNLQLPWLALHRRQLGLWCFFYATLHFLLYSIFDQSFSLILIQKDILDRPFILIGFLAWFLMIPLAFTSTNESIKKLGVKKWKRLHQIFYLVAALAPLHYFMMVKSDVRAPIFWILLIAISLVLRLKLFSCKKQL